MNSDNLEEDHEDQTHELALHEWFAIIFIMAFLLFLSFLSFFNSYSIGSMDTLHYLRSPIADVRIEGAVAKPGEYHFPVSTTLLAAIESASPLPSADLRRFRKNTKVHHGQLIVVHKRKMIDIDVQGAVSKSGVLQIPIGSHLGDLPKLLSVAENADMDFFFWNRRLHAGETIYVPTKSPNIQEWIHISKAKR
jgi:hypothetical protein